MDTHRKPIFQTHARELERRLQVPFPPFAVVDVRSAGEIAAGHIPGAIGIGGLDALPAEIGPATEVFVVGADPSDGRVRPIAERLLSLGVRRVVELTGGMHEWQALRLPRERAA